jgi:hypothetical protein
MGSFCTLFYGVIIVLIIKINLMKYQKKVVLAIALFSNLICYGTFYCRTNYQHNFSIAINSNNQLRAENESCKIEDLSELLYKYFTTNMYSLQKNEESKARFSTYTKQQCLENLKDLQYYKNSIDYKNRIQHQNRLLYVMNFLNVTKLRVLHPIELVSIKMKGKTTYNTYINVLSAVKKNTNRIRNEISNKLFKLNYRKIQVNQKSKRMRQYILVLKVLFPERIAEFPVRY